MVLFQLWLNNKKHQVGIKDKQTNKHILSPDDSLEDLPLKSRVGKKMKKRGEGSKKKNTKIDKSNGGIEIKAPFRFFS